MWGLILDSPDPHKNVLYCNKIYVYIRTVKTVKAKHPKGHKKIQFTQFSVNIGNF